MKAATAKARRRHYWRVVISLFMGWIELLKLLGAAIIIAAIGAGAFWVATLFLE
jgi:hypothetical protein